jgi:hypothetical protein
LLTISWNRQSYTVTGAWFVSAFTS